MALLFAGLLSIGLRHASFATGGFCGDGTTQFPEQCDDGNDANGDGCTTTCQLEFCGDGTVNNSGTEQCDDGNDMSGDGCSSTCHTEFCGDGTVNNNGTEQCDDGNSVNGDGCDSSCQNEFCGDGTVNNNGTEQCDDGNDVSGDGCNGSCQNEFCGDGIVNNDGTEQCDDGNTDNNDGCNNDCELASDGDGVAPVIEDAGPGYGANALNFGDGNGDGILDSTQSNVASLPTATGDGYLTVQSTGCNLTNVAAFTPGSQGGDPGRDYPFGLVGFTLPACESVQITVFYHAVATLPAGFEYRKYGPTTPGVPATTKFYTLPGVVFGSTNLDGSMVATAMFTLNDNQLGDDTGDDNTIVDQGGPAGGPHSVPATSNTGLVMMSVLLGLVGALAIRRLTTR